MPILSRFDPVTGKIVYGEAPDGSPGQAPLAMPGADPAAPSAPTMGMMAPPAQPMPTPAAASAPAALGGSTIIRPAPGGVTLPELSVTTAQPPPAPASNAGGGMMRQPLGQYYQGLEQARGLPDGYLARTRAVESANGTNLANPNSSARGDFQFIRSTAADMGINPMDPYDAARGAADLAQQNAAAFQKATGRAPSGADLYGMHQQGPTGYLGLLNGRAPGGDAQALNGGSGLNAGGFLGKIQAMYNNAKPDNLGPGAPNVASIPGGQNGGGQQQPAAAANNTVAATPATPPSNTYKGGLLGMFGVGDQSAPGMNKDFGGKMSDMLAQPGGGAIGTGIQALGTILGGGGQAAPKPAQFGPAPEDHKPESSLLAMMVPRYRRQQQGQA